MKLEDALQIPPGRTITLGPTAGLVTWDAIPALEDELVYSAATVDVVAATQTYHRNAGVWSGFAAGDLVDVAGFANDENNYRHRVVSVAGANMVVSSIDALVLEAAGPAVTFTRVGRLPRAVLLTGTSATAGLLSFGRVGDAYPASSAAFFFWGAGVHRLLDVSGFEILWYAAAAGGNGTVSAVANF